MLPLHSAILGSPTQTLHQWHYSRRTLLLLGTEGPVLGPRDTEGPTWSPRQTCLRQFTKYMIAANELASLSRVQMMYLLYTADKVCTQWLFSLIAVYVSIVFVSPLPDMLCTVCLSFTWHAVYVSPLPDMLCMSLLYLTYCVCLSFTWHAVYVSSWVLTSPPDSAVSSAAINLDKASLFNIYVLYCMC